MLSISNVLGYQLVGMPPMNHTVLRIVHTQIGCTHIYIHTTMQLVWPTGPNFSLLLCSQGVALRNPWHITIFLYMKDFSIFYAVVQCCMQIA